MFSADSEENSSSGNKVYEFLLELINSADGNLTFEIRLQALQGLGSKAKDVIDSGISNADLLQELLIIALSGKELLNVTAYEAMKANIGLLTSLPDIYINDLVDPRAVDISKKQKVLSSIISQLLESSRKDQRNEIFELIEEIVCSASIDTETKKQALQILIDNGAIDKLEEIAGEKTIAAELIEMAINGILSIKTLTEDQRNEILEMLVWRICSKSFTIEIEKQELQILIDNNAVAQLEEIAGEQTIAAELREMASDALLPGETGHDEESGSDDDEAVITDGGMDTKSDSGQSDAEIGQDTSGDGGDAPGGSGAVSFIARGPSILDLVDTNGIDIAEALSANKDYVSSEESKKAIMSFIETGYESANVTIPEGTNHPVLEYIYKGSMAGLLILPDVSAVDHTVAGNIMESNYTVAITH